MLPRPSKTPNKASSSHPSAKKNTSPNKVSSDNLATKNKKKSSGSLPPKHDPSEDKQEIHTPAAPAFTFRWIDNPALYFPDEEGSYNAGANFLGEYLADPKHKNAISLLLKYKGMRTTKWQGRFTEESVAAYKGPYGNPDNLTTVIFRIQYNGATVAAPNGSLFFCLLAPSNGYQGENFGKNLRAKINKHIIQTATTLNQASNPTVFFIPLTETSNTINQWLKELRGNPDKLSKTDADKPCSERAIINALLKMSALFHDNLSPLQGEVLSATNFLIHDDYDLALGNYETQSCCMVCRTNKKPSQKLLGMAATLPASELKKKTRREPSPVDNTRHIKAFAEETKQILTKIAQYKARAIEISIQSRFNLDSGEPMLPNIIDLSWVNKKLDAIENLKQQLELIEFIERYFLEDPNNRMIAALKKDAENKYKHIVLEKENIVTHPNILRVLNAAAKTIQAADTFPSIIESMQPDFITASQLLGEQQTAHLTTMNLLLTTWHNAAINCQFQILGISPDNYIDQPPQEVDKINEALTECKTSCSKLAQLYGISLENSVDIKSREHLLNLFHLLAQKNRRHGTSPFPHAAGSLSPKEWLNTIRRFNMHARRWLENHRRQEASMRQFQLLGFFAGPAEDKKEHPPKRAAKNITWSKIAS